MLDCFFNEIWKLRYTEMLETRENFLNMFSDDKKAIWFIKQYFDTHKSFILEWVYLKTDIERAQSTALSKIFVKKRDKKEKSIAFLDWVNSFKITNILLEEVKRKKIDVLKIIITPELWLAFQRIIKRDVVWNWKKKTKELDVVVKFRLEEAFHLLELFTLPALKEKNTYMIDATKNTDHKLTRNQIIDTLISLDNNTDLLLAEERWKEFDRHLETYNALLMDHFEWLL